MLKYNICDMGCLINSIVTFVLLSLEFTILFLIIKLMMMMINDYKYFNKNNQLLNSFTVFIFIKTPMSAL